jgi:hypothetical protein
MRFLAVIVALCAAYIPDLDRRHAEVLDPRRASGRTVRNCKVILLAAIAWLAWLGAAAARASPYPPVTPFVGDRYGSAQLGPEVARSVRCPPPACQRAGKARYLYPTRKRPPSARQKWRHVPIPAPRPLAEPGAVEPLSVAQGAWREAKRAVGRPRAWCGWWLGQHLGMPLRELWLARNWARVGSPASPGPGVIVVWRNHVGIITGRSDKGWIVKSGNDGRAVRERARSVAGAIAFRRLS